MAQGAVITGQRYVEIMNGYHKRLKKLEGMACDLIGPSSKACQARDVDESKFNMKQLSKRLNVVEKEICYYLDPSGVKCEAYNVPDEDNDLCGTNPKILTHLDKDGCIHHCGVRWRRWRGKDGLYHFEPCDEKDKHDNVKMNLFDLALGEPCCHHRSHASAKPYYDPCQHTHLRSESQVWRYNNCREQGHSWSECNECAYIDMDNPPYWMLPENKKHLFNEETGPERYKPPVDGVCDPKREPCYNEWEWERYESMRSDPAYDPCYNTEKLTGPQVVDFEKCYRADGNFEKCCRNALSVTPEPTRGARPGQATAPSPTRATRGGASATSDIEEDLKELAEGNRNLHSLVEDFKNIRATIIDEFQTALRLKEELQKNLNAAVSKEQR